MPSRFALATSPLVTVATFRTLEGGEAAKQGGAGITWQIDLGLAFLSIDGETAAGESHGVAALLLRPRVERPLDRRRLEEAYLAWASHLQLTDRRLTTIPDTPPNVALREIVLGHRGEDLACEPLSDDEIAVQAVTDAWLETEDYQRAVEASDGLGKSHAVLLRDHPYLLAYQARPQKLWDPSGDRDIPDHTSCMDEVQPVPSNDGAGRPRSFGPLSLEGQIVSCLLKQRPAKAEISMASGGSSIEVDLRAVFALQLVLGDDDADFTHDRTRCLQWLLGGTDRPPTGQDITRQSSVLARRRESWNRERRIGRSVAEIGSREVRKIVPTLIFDRSTFLVPLTRRKTDPLKNVDACLVDWLRSERVDDLMAIVTGRDTRLLKMVCTTGGWEGFHPQRALPFHRVSLWFKPEDERYRDAVAMVPGAQPGEDLVMDVMGFAADPMDIVRRRFGGLAGEVVGMRTVARARRRRR